MQINGRHMLQLADLLADFFDNIRMAVSDRNGDDAGEAIEILLAFFVPQVLHVPFDQQQRIAVIRDQPGVRYCCRRARTSFLAGPL